MFFWVIANRLNILNCYTLPLWRFHKLFSYRHIPDCSVHVIKIVLHFSMVNCNQHRAIPSVNCCKHSFTFRQNWITFIRNLNLSELPYRSTTNALLMIEARPVGNIVHCPSEAQTNWFEYVWIRICVVRCMWFIMLMFRRSTAAELWRKAWCSASIIA